MPPVWSAAGVSVTLERYEGMIHGFLRRSAIFDQGKAAVESVATWLRDRLG